MEHTQIVDRLRASYASTAEAEFEEGHTAGVDWAAKRGEADELMYLQDKTDDAIDALYSGNLKSTPFEEYLDWEGVTGGLDDPSSRQFVRGFVAGAIEVWEKVEDEVRSQ